MDNHRDMAIAPCLKDGKSTTLQRLEVQQPSVRLSTSRSWGVYAQEKAGMYTSQKRKTGAKMTCNSYLDTPACHILFVQSVSKVLVVLQ